MGDPGRQPTISDVEILHEFVVRPDPAFHATELVDALGLSRQGISKRLETLETRNYLDSKLVANRRIWWIKPMGRQYYYEETRPD